MTEVRHHAVAQILGDATAIYGNRFGRGPMIAGNQLSPFFRFEVSGDL
jgi:hypothetical protein